MTSLFPAVVAVTLLAQATTVPKPDFSGTWTMDPERSESALQEQPIGRVVLAVTQTESTISIETRRGDQSSVAAYAIEAPPHSPGAIGAGTRRAYWDGLRLVTEGGGNVQGQTVSTRETRTLNAQGTEMTVETLVMVQHGYTFRGARNYGAAKDVYTRAAR